MVVMVDSELGWLVYEYFQCIFWVWTNCFIPLILWLEAHVGRRIPETDIYIVLLVIV